MIWDDVYENIHLTHPLAAFKHILAWYHDWNPRVIFDVGANVGTYAKWYFIAYPDSLIFCFEPGKEAFEQLKAGAGAEGAICINKALSSKSGTAKMKSGLESTGNRIVSRGGDFEVEVTTGREFCAEKGLEKIDFLKVDVEGHELKVLDGFDLSKVDFVQVEAGMNRHVAPCVPFPDLYAYFVSKGFYLFNIFGGVWDSKQGSKEHIVRWDGTEYIYQTGAPVLRRADPVFINGKFVEVE